MNKWKKTILGTGVIILILSLVVFYFPTWTPKIKTENGISTLEQVDINGSKHAIMIRGHNLDNPVILFVHGGPASSELPFAKKNQDLLESRFTVVNYDQRASGKSYHFSEDYSNLSADLLVEDLLAITDYTTERLGKKKVILIGHSFGTYIGTLAAQKAPEKFEAYIGIGQVGDVLLSETESWSYVVEQARLAGNEKDVQELEQVAEAIKQGQAFTPRQYVKKYGGAARLMENPDESFWGKALSSEYNIVDAFRHTKGMSYSQEILIGEAMVNSLPSRVTEMDLPIYFVMGDYDYMTSSLAAKLFFEGIEAEQKEFISYEQSAHYPHYEEKERFLNWMVKEFIQ